MPGMGSMVPRQPSPALRHARPAGLADCFELAGRLTCLVRSTMGRAISTGMNIASKGGLNTTSAGPFLPQVCAGVAWCADMQHMWELLYHLA